jgi:serine/threonine protein kinase
MTNNETELDELQPGAQLLNGQYTIESFLNVGGFGITYLAKDSLDRTVVIKECYPTSFCRRVNQEVTVRSRSFEREYGAMLRLFVAEAKQLSRLRHPNIVGVHQVFEENSTAYMAIDYIKGRDVADILDEETTGLSVEDIVAITRKLLDAIRYIHNNDILHRDISPDNILINDKNDPVLIDFGAAREEATRSNRTMTAMRVVKDGYSPQEFYITGSDHTTSSDLYSLAASIYHLIHGEAPIDSQQRLASIAEGQIDPNPPLTGAHEGYPPNFLEAMDKALNVLPKDRIQSADEWLDMLDGRSNTVPSPVSFSTSGLKSRPKSEPVVEPEPALQVAPSPEPRNKLSLAAMAMGGLIVAGAVGGGIYTTISGSNQLEERGKNTQAVLDEQAKTLELQASQLAQAQETARRAAEAAEIEKTARLAAEADAAQEANRVSAELEKRQRELEEAAIVREAELEALRQAAAAAEAEKATLLAEQEAADAERAALLAEQQASEEEKAELMAAQKAAEEEKAKLLAAQETAEAEKSRLLAAQQAADEERARLLAAQQASDEEKAALMAAQEKAAQENAELLAAQKAAEEKSARIAAEMEAKESELRTAAVADADEKQRISEELKAAQAAVQAANEAAETERSARIATEAAAQAERERTAAELKDKEEALERLANAEAEEKARIAAELAEARAQAAEAAKVAEAEKQARIAAEAAALEEKQRIAEELRNKELDLLDATKAEAAKTTKIAAELEAAQAAMAKALQEAQAEKDARLQSQEALEAERERVVAVLKEKEAELLSAAEAEAEEKSRIERELEVARAEAEAANQAADAEKSARLAAQQDAQREQERVTETLRQKEQELLAAQQAEEAEKERIAAELETARLAAQEATEAAERERQARLDNEKTARQEQERVAAELAKKEEELEASAKNLALERARLSAELQASINAQSQPDQLRTIQTAAVAVTTNDAQATLAQIDPATQAILDGLAINRRIWSMTLPFSFIEGKIDGSKVAIISKADSARLTDDEAEWLRPGLAIYAVDGAQLGEDLSMDQVTLGWAETATPPVASFDFLVKTRGANSQETKTFDLRWTRRLLLENGFEFEIYFEDGRWITSVTASPHEAADHILTGDILVSDQDGVLRFDRPLALEAHIKSMIDARTMPESVNILRGEEELAGLRF